MSKTVDKNGFWEIEKNPVSAEGVFFYSGKMIGADGLEPDKLYPVYRSAEELEKSAKTFNNKPFFEDHTAIGEGATKYDDKPAQGNMSNVHFENGKLYATLSIWSEKLKKLIEDGKKELSLGYRCIYEPIKGVFNGQPYDFVQKNLVGNHLALVDAGRCGKEVSVMDSLTFDSIEISGEMKEKETEDEFFDLRHLDEILSKSSLSEKQREWIKAEVEKKKYSRNSKQEKENKNFRNIKMPTGEDEAPEDNINNNKQKMSEENKDIEKKEVKDEQKVDKRKLIDEIGGILKSNGLDDEIIKTVLKKAEEISYSGSEASKSDDEGEEDKSKEEEKKEKVDAKDGEGDKEKEQGDACSKDEESKGEKTAMDADEIRKSIMQTLHQMNAFAKELAPICGEFSFDSMENLEDMAKEACKRLKLNDNGCAYATIKGYIANNKTERFTSDKKDRKVDSSSVQDKVNKLFE